MGFGGGLSAIAVAHEDAYVWGFKARRASRVWHDCASKFSEAAPCCSGCGHPELVPWQEHRSRGFFDMTGLHELVAGF